MRILDKKDEIKKALLQGGLVVSGRGTGKTRALAEILLEDSDAILIVDNEAQFKRAAGFLLEGGMPQTEINNRVLRSARVESFLVGLHDKNVYVDEWSSTKYDGSFKAATVTMPFPVKVVK